MKIVLRIIIAFFAIIIGIYPILYFLVDMSSGFLAGKSAQVLANPIWETIFYIHICNGGIALLVGWLQFSRRIRTRKPRIHRAIGKIYVLTCVFAGTAGMYLAVYATGGTISSIGFGSLAFFWLYTTIKAYVSIRNRNTEIHRRWMIRSYALTFAAVTLRIWLPLGLAIGYDFDTVYRIIAWLCWIPNLAVAELIIRWTSRAVGREAMPA